MYINSVKEIFQNYFGNVAVLLGIVLCLVLFLLIRGKKDRIFWGGYFLILLVCLYNELPWKLFNKVLGGSSSSIYYRFWWMVPWLIFVAILIIEVVNVLKKSFRKENREKIEGIIVVALAVCVVSISFFAGKSYYATGFNIPETEQIGLSEEMQQIGEIIIGTIEPDKELITVMGDSEISDVVLYDYRLELAYERTNLIDYANLYQNGDKGDAQFFQAIVEGRRGNASEVSKYLDNVNLDYLICNRAFALEDFWAESRFSLIGQTENYSVFVNERKNKLIEYKNGSAEYILNCDDTGTVIDNEFGNAGVHYLFDKKNRVIGVEFVNSNRERADSGNGYSAIKYELNSKGQTTEVVYLDINDIEVNITGGFSKTVIEYNNGSKQKEMFYNTEGTLVKTLEYDDKGNIK